MNARFQLEEEQVAINVRVDVVSCSLKRVVVMIPSWSEEVAVVIPAGDPCFPRSTTKQGGEGKPAVHMRYRCTVDYNGPTPKITSWVVDGEPELPHPAPPDCGVPSPPDQLPVRQSGALDRMLRKTFKTMTDPDRKAVAYMIARAHGQGFADGLRSRA